MSSERVILDTNVLVSALLKKATLPSDALKFCLKNHSILVSKTLIIEISATLSKSKIRKFIPRDTADLFLIDYFNACQYIVPDCTVELCRDPHDNHILELAKTGNATYIITGDDDLLSLKMFENTIICTPKEFLAARIT